MSLTIMPTPHQQFLNNAGAILSGGFLYTYAAGTTTPLETYSDEAGTVENANPILLNSAGRPWNSTSEINVYLLPRSYKFVLQTSAGVEVWTSDHVPAVPTLDASIDVTGTAGEALTAGQAVYLSDGSGSLTAGQWYRTDADLVYASTGAGIVGLVPAVIASGDSGVIRLLGRVTGLSSLTAGAAQYVSATAGDLTGTAPANARFVGVADTTTSLVLAPNPLRALPALVSHGRLTLTTGVPVTTADVTAATTLFFAPYQGNQIALYDGAAWHVRTFSQLSIAVPATTDQLYDVFVYDNAGTATLELTAWTNDTTRATALTTQNGVYVKSGALTRRYLGSFRTTGVSGQTEDSLAKRYVWNYYHRVPRALRRIEATASWTYTTATWRQANAAAGNQVDVVVGVAEVPIDVRLNVAAGNSSSGIVFYAGIGEDVTNAPSTDGLIGQGATNATAATNQTLVNAQLVKYPAVGRHIYTWLEKSAATGTTTWFGSSTTEYAYGLVGAIDG